MLRVRIRPKALRAVRGSFFKLWESKEKLTGQNTLPAVRKTKIKKFSVEVRLFEIKYLKTKTPNLKIYMKFSLKIGLLSLFFFFLARLYCDENEN